MSKDTAVFRQDQATAKWQRQCTDLAAVNEERQRQIAGLVGALQGLLERVGRYGKGPDDTDEWYCEFCGAHDSNCYELTHEPLCPISIARAALAPFKESG